MVHTKYTKEEDAEAEATTLVTRMVKNKQVAEKTIEKSSDHQTNSESVAAESLQNMNSQEAFVLNQAKVVAREIGSSVAHIVKQKTIEAA